MGSLVTFLWASFLLIFSLLRLSILDLRSGTGQTDGQADRQIDRRRPSTLNAPNLWHTVFENIRKKNRNFFHLFFSNYRNFTHAKFLHNLRDGANCRQRKFEQNHNSQFREKLKNRNSRSLLFPLERSETDRHSVYLESGLGVTPWLPKRDVSGKTQFWWYPTFDRMVFSPTY